MEAWDLIIIGGGVAGLTAGIYGVRSGLKTLILEEEIAGGAAADAPIIENYPGFEKVSGVELVQRIVAQCQRVGAEIREFEKVVSLDLKAEDKIVKTSKGVYGGKALIIASGTSYRELNIPGEAEFKGRGVSYCAICDGPLFKGKRVLVVGGGNSAVSTALYLADVVSEVKVAHRRDYFRAEEALARSLMGKSNVEVLWSNELREIKGEKKVSKAVLYNNKTGEIKELQVDGVFVQVGEAPNSKIAKEAGVDVDEHGYIKVDSRQRTNVKGVYAAGDVANHPFKQVGVAVGQGATAALEAYGYIRRPYHYK